MWLLKTIFISSILGISLGTVAGLTAQLLTPLQTSIVKVQPKKIILSSNNECCKDSQTEITTSDQIVAAQIVNGDVKIDPPATPTPTETPQIAPIILAKSLTEATATAIINLSSQETEGETNQLIITESSSQGLDANLLFNLINQYRERKGLANFTKDDNLCSLAQTRSQELVREFEGGRLHSGLYNRNLPYWITENAILMRTEDQAFNWWLRSSVHRHSIESDYKYSCLACSGYSCSELFTSYTSKN
jgi:uncharacterized protein YkwD